jgi:hypothetical protein
VEKTDSDGIVISYMLPRGGMAMAKIYFNELSSELQLKYNKKK